MEELTNCAGLVEEKSDLEGLRVKPFKYAWGGEWGIMLLFLPGNLHPAAQARQQPQHRGEGGYKIPPLAKELVAMDC